jgi:3-hydroxyisobutyrate dehydrogenase-like beta-hydroxyacid dehydrogenase
MTAKQPAGGTGTALRVAILGTGKMGAAIAGRLDAEGFRLTLWNRTRARAAALDIGTVADSPAAACADADVVLSSLTGPDAVRAAYSGPRGALTAGRGKVFVEMSTAGAEIVPELAAAVTKAGSRLVVAPILGAPPIVRAGQAALIVGGEESDLAIVRGVLERLGSIRYVGPTANAAGLKLVANSMLADVILAAAELQVAGERIGLDAADVFWALERLAPALGLRKHGYLENRHQPTLFAVRDLRKDLDFAASVFGRAGARTPLTSLVRDHFTAAESSSGDLDITAAIEPYREAVRKR